MVSSELWEVGSEFHWTKLPRNRGGNLLPAPHVLFATGRASLIALAAMKAKENRPRLHLPCFFCPEVTASLAQWFEILFYEDFPDEPGPRFSSLEIRSGDMVLAVNFFGVREGSPWEPFRRNYGDVMLIEDHTHDPFSAWSVRSRADYAIASIRKTLPVPDGGLMWSPRGFPLPHACGAVPRGSYLKFQAMILKQAYLTGVAVAKETFRDLQAAGERDLAGCEASKASEVTNSMLSLIPIKRLRNKRELNVRSFLRMIEGDRSLFRPLFTHWPEGNAPLGAVLLCRNNCIREKLLSHLIENKVYAAVHWRLTATAARQYPYHARQLAACLLTIPIDHRYGNTDLCRISDMLRRFVESRKTINISACSVQED